METLPKPQSGKSQQISITEFHHTTPESRFCYFFNEVFLFFKFYRFLYGSLDRLGMTGESSGGQDGLGRTGEGWWMTKRVTAPALRRR